MVGDDGLVVGIVCPDQGVRVRVGCPQSCGRVDDGVLLQLPRGMRVFAPAAVVSALLCIGCPPPPEQSCGQSTVLPGDDDVADGNGTATRSDDVDFDEPGTWSAQQLSITIGVLDMIVTDDEGGDDVADLIEAAAFPICIPIGERSDTSGAANLVAGGFVSDADHTGGVAILGKDGNTLLGRFSFDLVSGDTVISFTDGAFRVPQR